MGRCAGRCARRASGVAVAGLPRRARAAEPGVPAPQAVFASGATVAFTAQEPVFGDGAGVAEVVVILNADTCRSELARDCKVSVNAWDLTHRYREQAHSYSDFAYKPGSPVNANAWARRCVQSPANARLPA